jgi:choline dehydrogenase
LKYLRICAPALVIQSGREPLNIQTNYLTCEYDVSVLLAGIKFAREIVQTGPFKDMLGPELLPRPQNGTDESKLRQYIKSTCITDSHPSGTCKMGLGAMAVVDPRLRV